MGGEDGQARVLERDEAHQRVAVRALAADLVGVGAGGLVAVVAVGDQQLGVGERGGDRLVDRGVGDPPDAVDGAVVVGHLAPRVGVEVAARRAARRPRGGATKIGERLWRVARVSRRRSSFGPGLGALVGADPAGAVLGRRGPGRGTRGACADSPSGAVYSCVSAQIAGSRSAREDALQRPLLERLGGVLVGIAAVGRLRAGRSRRR